MSVNTPGIVVTPEESGQRLDHVLARLEPLLGLRGRRRLCAQGRVLVNGRPGKEAFRLRSGDAVELRVETSRSGAAVAAVRVVRRSDHLAALDKAAGLHSEALAGKNGDSVQARLPELLPACAEAPRLLNRLDFPTSGLLLAALDREGAEQWKRAQEAGLTEKRYLALLEGAMDGERVMRQSLALKGRERVLVELAEHPDARRHTRLLPLAVLPFPAVLAALGLGGEADDGAAGKGGVRSASGLASQQVTLAGCLILKGARHQIRAHASAAGFPLLGDRRYGASWLLPLPDADVPETERERFFLHHGRVTLPGFAACCAPWWLEGLEEAARSAGLAWLKQEGAARTDGEKEEGGEE